MGMSSETQNKGSIFDNWKFLKSDVSFSFDYRTRKSKIII